MKRTAFAFGLLLALGLGFVQVAEARDIEITVPVRIANLHPTVAVGRVQCMALSGASMVGSAGRADFTLTNGTFTGDILVRLTLTESMLRQASTWKCELRFVRPHDGYAHSLSLEGGDHFHEEFRLAPGSEHRFQVQGSL